MTVYGIKNCDTVQRALNRLQQEGLDYRFHDFKAAGLTPEKAASWIGQVGADIMLNRKGTTWRKLDVQTQAQAQGAALAALLAAQPSLVKRPVIEYGGGVIVGFAKADEDAIIGKLRGA